MGVDVDQLKTAIIEEIRTVFDPEIPVNVYDMGMIYEININDEGHAHVKMTLTSPACPVAGSLPPEVEQKVAGVDGVTRAEVELVWDPPWTMEYLSEAAKLQLGLI
ncbi:MAG: SUF system Fe-S cluster assembly protein [Planctomycetota bacterium]|jgi:FeS assembly SUF system protein